MKIIYEHVPVSTTRMAESFEVRDIGAGRMEIEIWGRDQSAVSRLTRRQALALADAISRAYATSESPSD